MNSQNNYKAWFEKYRPQTIDDLVFPNKDIAEIISVFYNNKFINGNILSYGPPGFGKSSVSEVLIKQIIKNQNDLFILGRKTEDVDNLKRWLQQQPVHSQQKIVKIEEMDRLSTQAQIVLKDGLMEKFQHNTAFLATTNSPEKIDPALLTRFNTRINFGELPIDGVHSRLCKIAGLEGIDYGASLDDFVQKYHKRGLRDLISNLELASIDGTFQPAKLDSFIGTTGNEDLIVQYIVYLMSYLETLDTAKITEIKNNPKSDQTFFTYYEYMLKLFKKELRLNYHTIYRDLFDSNIDMAKKNIVQNYWQDLELKRFKHTHTVALVHDLIQDILDQRKEI